MTRYAVTIFLGAFLLFQVQPLIGRLILPWFGGGPAVWTTCMLFFQVLLLAGYAYAHWITSRLPIGRLRGCQLALLLASLGFLPIAWGAAAWKPVGGEMPVTKILALLSVTIGLPYFLLSSTGPLLQESFRRETGRAPYRLYSLSNIGSLLALLSYPFVFEPQLSLHTQRLAWSGGYAVFTICCGWCVWRFPAATAGGRSATGNEQAARPTWRVVVLWLLLAACGSTMLLATTNQICQEIPAIPFLWVLPLALYLLTFIICFDHERWYHRNLFLALLTVAVLVAGVTMYAGSAMGLGNQLASYSATLFVCCMVCHGELTRAKPVPRDATLFYLVVAAGGALGGILVAVIAPWVLPDFWEYQIGLVATVVLAFVATFGPHAARSVVSHRRLAAACAVSVAVGLAIILVIHLHSDQGGDEKTLERSRNFYGVLEVNRISGANDENGPSYDMVHGQTQHGLQYLDPAKRRWPTAYYGPSSGVGLALRHHPRRTAEGSDRTLRIGVIGLGCGTLAAYGEAGDVIRFYEINPEVVRLSDKYFTYRRDSRATLELVLGDARINLERELDDDNPQRFDVLAVDAFSSDSIPTHLLTQECVEIYRRHMQPDGLLCLHLSNKYLNLSGIVQAIAEAVGCRCAFVDSASDPAHGIGFATWAIVTTNAKFLETPEVRKSIVYWNSSIPLPPVWTDDYSSLWHVLKH